ncbi:hypothetical protein [Vibrio rotiferianus]|uniref:hypothetical protein n=1 Tax=Vibrio rotiferianus TaxID=190895 RepID=UPI0005EE7EE6|nr:hypothetical protein [Vibrio rotiferianus]
MKKVALLITATSIFSFSVFGASWNFEEPGFNADGNVSLNLESGEVRTVNNNTSMFTTSNSPTVVNMQASSVGAPMAFKPVTRTIHFRGQQENRVPIAHASYAYYAQHTLSKKCLVRSITGSIRSQRGATYDLLGEVIELNGAIIRIPNNNAGVVEQGSLTGSNKYHDNGVYSTWDLRDFDWNLFKTYRASSGSGVLLYFEQPILLEKIGMGKTYISDPWVSYNLSYNCMAEY